MVQTMQLDVPSQPQHCSLVLIQTMCSCSDTRLRSTTQGNYVIPRTHRHLANHAFTVAAPSSWNSLPDIDNVRDSESYSNFLSKLKTHYFNIAFYNHIIC